jgi:hypothetical protein
MKKYHACHMIVLLVCLTDFSKTLWQATLLLTFLTWNYEKIARLPYLSALGGKFLWQLKLATKL